MTRFSLFHKALFAVLLLVLPVSFVFIYSYNENKKYIEKDVLNDNSEVADLFEGQVYQLLDGSSKRAMDFASDGFIRTELERIGRRAGAEALNKHLKDNKLTLDKSIHDIYILSAAGRVVSSTDASAIGKAASNEELFRKGSREVSIAESGIFRGSPELLISAPILDSAKRPEGVLTAAISFSELDRIISGGVRKDAGPLARGQGVYRPQWIYLVNKDGFVFAGDRQKAAAKFHYMPAVAQCLNKKSGYSGFYENYSGIAVAGASACLPGMGWTLIVETDKAEAFMPSKVLLRGAAVAGISAIGLIAVLFIIFFKAVLKPLRELARAAKEIAGGNYDIRLPSGSKDEIGALTESFNGMSQSVRKGMEALRESEESFRALAENANDGIIIAVGDGDFVYANRRAAEITGYGVEELVRSGIKDLAHPEVVEYASERFRKIIEGRPVPRSHETRMLSKDRKTITVEITSARTIWHGRAADLAIFRDISERKRMEETQARLTGIIEATTDFVAMGDAGGRVLYYNRAARAMLGIGEDEDISNILYSDTHPEWSNRIVREEGIPAAMRNGIWSGETALLSRGGREIPVSQVIMAHKAPDGTVKSLSTIARDVTERKRAEEALRTAEAKYRSLIERLPETIWIYTAGLDDVATTIYVSPHIKVLGFTQEEWIEGKDLWSRRLHPEDRERVLAEFRLARSSGAALASEYRMVTRDKKVLWFRDEYSVIRDEAGRPLSFQGVMMDITRRKKNEQALSEKTAKLKELNKDLHDLTIKIKSLEEKERKRFAEILHEGIGQNLVAARIAYKNRLKRCVCGDKENSAPDILCLLDESIKACRAMTADLYPAPLSDMGLTRAIRWYAWSILEQAGVKVEFDFEVEPEGLGAEHQQALFSIVRECFQNISKYASATEVSVTCLKEDDSCRLTIRDNGEGFDVQEARTKKGRGFGLILVREWSRSIGGTLDIDSKPGNGTAVSVVFPLQQ